MPRQLFFLCALLILVSSLPFSIPAQAQGGTAPTLEAQIQVPGPRESKFPKVAVGNGVLHYAANSAQLDALYWNKAEDAREFGDAFRVGTAEGQSDYSSPALFLSSDNSLYYTWSSIEERRIKLRVRASDGTWGPERTVISGAIFGIFAQVAATPERVFVIWQDVRRDGNDPEVFARTSTDNGATWSSTIFASSVNTFSTPPAISVSSAGQFGIAYNSGNLEIYASFWNGSSFSSEKVSSGVEVSNPSISFGPDGKAYVGYRGAADSGVSSGAFLAERQAANQWTSRRIVTSFVIGAVNVVVDANNAIHLGWVGRPGGSPQVFYALLVDGQSVGIAAGSGGANFNAHLAVDRQGSGYAHIAAERFDGSGIARPYYYLFRTASGPSGTRAVPVIEEGVDVVRDKGNVIVRFEEVTNEPTEILWKWGGAPTDSDNDSDGWKPFSNPITIAVPDAVPTNCSQATLYTLVRNSSTTQASAANDSIRIDGTIDAAVAASNPYLQRRSPIFSNSVLDDFGSDGASDGAPGYTRVPVFYLEMQGKADCSGLKDIATGQSTTNILPAYTVSDDKFANVVPFPSLPVEGQNTVLVRVSDGAGNIEDFAQSFVYDVEAPLVSTSTSDSLTLGTTSASLLVNLQVNGVQISDDHYPSPGFWGVWVANSRTPLEDPTLNGGLIWTPVQVSATGGTFTIREWSLASGLPENQVTIGDYYVYLRFLDGAGNPSSTYLEAQISLSQITKPAIYLPAIVKP
ncbi:MAG: hypothetical protein HC822_10695 [Oscillochloris sp.]|nr:hypothetical protein [Oscillochloris sp.]